MNKSVLLLGLLLGLIGCAETPPRQQDNLCGIFNEKDDWYDDTLRAARRWGAPIAVQLAFIQQESSFVADARPPRLYLLGFIPWFRDSSSYGYAQAQDDTWSDYQDASGNSFADRDDFADSCDFISWYCRNSHQKLGIPFNDVKNLYLSYHEGWSGYQRKTYLQKPELLQIADKVRQRALKYDAQLSACRAELETNR